MNTPKQEQQAVIDLLKKALAQVEYPPDLLSARRAAFIAQIKSRPGLQTGDGGQ